VTLNPGDTGGDVIQSRWSRMFHLKDPLRVVKGGRSSKIAALAGMPSVCERSKIESEDRAKRTV